MLKHNEYSRKHHRITQMYSRAILRGAVDELDNKIMCYIEKALTFEVPHSVELLIKSYFQFHEDNGVECDGDHIAKLDIDLYESVSSRKYAILHVYELMSRTSMHVAIVFYPKKYIRFHNDMVEDKETEFYDLDRFIDYQLGRTRRLDGYRLPISHIDYDWYQKKTQRGDQKRIADHFGVGEAAVSKWISSLRNGKATDSVKAKLYDFYLLDNQ